MQRFSNVETVLKKIKQGCTASSECGKRIMQTMKWKNSK